LPILGALHPGSTAKFDIYEFPSTLEVRALGASFPPPLAGSPSRHVVPDCDVTDQSSIPGLNTKTLSSCQVKVAKRGDESPKCRVLASDEVVTFSGCYSFKIIRCLERERERGEVDSERGRGKVHSHAIARAWDRPKDHIVAKRPSYALVTWDG
ncbi:hypothetical protein NPIL_461731, partial [Nephila pilipes]